MSRKKDGNEEAKKRKTKGQGEKKKGGGVETGEVRGKKKGTQIGKK